MKKQKRNNIIVGAVVVVAAALIIIFSGGGGAQAETVKMGFMTDLSGPASPYGSEIEKGARLARNEIEGNKIDGKNFSVTFEDTQCDGSESASIMNKFFSVNDIKLSGGTVCSNVVLPISPIVEENDGVHISTAATSPRISEEGDHLFRLWPSDDLEAGVLADYATNNLSIENASVIYVNTDFGVDLSKAFENSFENNGGEILSSQKFASEARDFKTQLTQIKEENPEAIYMNSHPEQAPIITKQIREFGINSTILSYGPPIQAEGTLNSSGDHINGVYLASPKFQDSEDFVQKYEEEYGSSPGVGASAGYDTMMLMFKSMENCAGYDSQCIKDYLNGLEGYEGAAWTITFDENGDISPSYQVKRIENKEPVVVAEQ